MSDPRFHARAFAARTIALAVIASWLAGRTASGQTVAEYRHLVDSLAVGWRSELAANATRDSVRVRALPHDTIRVGPLTILADDEHSSVARRAASRAAPAIVSAFGHAAIRVAAHPILVRANPDTSKPALMRTVPWRLADDSLPAARERVVQTALVDSAGELHVEASGLNDVDWLAAIFRHHAARILSGAAGQDLEHWLGTDLPIDVITPLTWPSVRIDLVTAASSAARECYRGATSRCADALGIVPIADPAMVWYDADERRALVLANLVMLRQRGNEAAYDRCTVTRVPAACDSVVHLIPASEITPPFSPADRQAFLRVALSLGGDGAFDRLVGSSGSVAHRLELSAGVPIDSALRAWRTKALEARVGTTTMTGATAVSSLFWIALCGALALRSSRWR